MPRAIISPSVLASDFGQLTAECKRMILGGAEWLHMGKFPDLFPFKFLTLSSRRYGWVNCLHAITLNLYLIFNSHFVPNITMGMYFELSELAGVLILPLRSANSLMCP